jgi:type IV pilus biogenesis protein CpaD/CtpE
MKKVYSLVVLVVLAAALSACASMRSSTAQNYSNCQANKPNNHLYR